MQPIDVVHALQEKEYIRQRINPNLRDQYYLHLSDLLACIELTCARKYPRILDFGCGSSPYRSLFDCEAYDRADYSKMDGIKYSVTSEGRIPDVSSSFYDLVLSTQVLEHLAMPEVYLAESWRVLKPGGTMMLSTHGCFVDHGCPFDYRRWTLDGLKLDLQRAGFEVERMFRLTSGVRAVLFWLQQVLYSPFPKQTSLLNLCLRVFRRIHNRNNSFFTKLVDSNTRHLAVLSEGVRCETDMYIGIFVIAKKRC